MERFVSSSASDSVNWGGADFAPGTWDTRGGVCFFSAHSRGDHGSSARDSSYIESKVLSLSDMWRLCLDGLSRGLF